MHLLTSQKNILFKLIESVDLEPEDFKLIEHIIPFFNSTPAGLPCTTINYNNKKFNYYFKVFETMNGHKIECAPGRELLTSDKSFVLLPIKWDSIKHEFAEWLTNLKREVNEINLWDELKKFSENRVFREMDLHSSEKFNRDEKKYLKANLLLLKQKFLELKFLSSYNDIIEDKIDDLIEKVDSQNKFDWFTYFVGVITSIVINWCVTPEQGATIFKIVKNIFGSIHVIAN